MYTDENFKTKKALKEAVNRGEEVTYYQPGPFGGKEPQNGTVYIEGPHDYHKWYAKCEARDGHIVKVS